MQLTLTSLRRIRALLVSSVYRNGTNLEGSLGRSGLLGVRSEKSRNTDHQRLGTYASIEREFLFSQGGSYIEAISAREALIASMPKNVAMKPYTMAAGPPFMSADPITLIRI
jgi:hypothetical protein